MPLFKNVNGNRVELSEKEESEIRAEWAQSDRINAKEAELQVVVDQIPSMELRIEALENCMMKYLENEDDEHAASIKSCIRLKPEIEEKKRLLEEEKNV